MLPNLVDTTRPHRGPRGGYACVTATGHPKRRYTKTAAKTARRHHQAVHGGHVAIYRCPTCAAWHIGNTSPDPAKASR